MVSKKELNEQVEDLRKRAVHAEREARGLQVEVTVHKLRESQRMRRDHEQKQRELRAAEQADKVKRRQELRDGLVRLKEASEWAIVHDERGAVLELTMPLSADEAMIAHRLITKRGEVSEVSVPIVPNLDEWQAGWLAWAQVKPRLYCTRGI